MHTYVSNGLGTASPDGRFRLAIEAHGAGGKAYSDRSDKRVYIWVVPHGGSNAAPVFKGDYAFVAADLHWRVRWPSTNQVSVEFFEYDGPRLNKYEKLRTITNEVARLSFAEQAGAFVEQKR
jgi:hypothetical protein